MTGAAFLLLVLAVVAATVDWVAVAQERKAIEYLAKPATMGLLLLAALALDPDQTDVRAWFVIALGFSLLGDVLLMLPKDLFVAGLGAFLVAHLAYVVGLNLNGVEAVPLFVGILIVMAAVLVLGRRIVGAVRSSSNPEMATPVIAYMFVISAMVASAIGTTQPAAIAGASLFYASDALIAWNRFIAPTRRGALVIMITYHLGQLLLVLSLL